MGPQEIHSKFFSKYLCLFFYFKWEGYSCLLLKRTWLNVSSQQFRALQIFVTALKSSGRCGAKNDKCVGGKNSGL